MRYIESPGELEYQPKHVSLFLAGGITNCPDWQQEMRKLLCDTDLILLNPRRADFPIGDPSAAQQQITWEYQMLRRADIVLFWFPCETLCPIVLYELGAWSMTLKPICVGVHPEYQRLQDVMIQTSLAKPNVQVVSSLQELATQAKQLSSSAETQEHIKLKREIA